MTDSVTVRWYDCNCAWVTKFCDEEHTRFAIVPRDVLLRYMQRDAEPLMERYPSASAVSAETVKGVPEYRRGR